MLNNKSDLDLKNKRLYVRDNLKMTVWFKRGRLVMVGNLVYNMEPAQCCCCCGTTQDTLYWRSHSSVQVAALFFCTVTNPIPSFLHIKIILFTSYQIFYPLILPDGLLWETCCYIKYYTKKKLHHYFLSFTNLINLKQDMELLFWNCKF